MTPAAQFDLHLQNARREFAAGLQAMEAKWETAVRAVRSEIEGLKGPVSDALQNIGKETEMYKVELERT